MGKLNFTKALKNALPYVLTLILVGIMTFVAEILDEGEIIFPEITALAIGYMVTQKQGWKVNDSRMIALIAICAVAGVMTVRYIKVGPYLEILIAFVFAQILFMLSGTTFAPMISVGNGVARYDADRELYIPDCRIFADNCGCIIPQISFESKNKR